MPLESATFVNQLDQTRPTATDVKSEGDDVMRLIKSTLKNSLPNIGGAMNASHTELNRMVGATEDVQPRLSASLSAPNGETLNRLPAAASRQGGFITFNASTGQPEVSFSLGAASGNSLGIFNVANVTTFFTNGAERMRIDASGNVGIGTASPYNTSVLSLAPGASRNGIGIDIANSGGVYTGLYLNRTASDGNYIVFDRNATRIGTIDVSGTSLVVTTNNNERMRIDASGSVGIGATPFAWNNNYKVLQLGSGGWIAGRVGSFGMETGSNWYRDGAAAYVRISTDAPTFFGQETGQFIWSNAPAGAAGSSFTFSTRMVLDANGNLGIGTSSVPAGRRLAVAGGAVRIDADTNLEFGGSSAGLYGNSASNYVVAFTNTTERMRIDASGNVITNVNTAAPTLTTNQQMVFALTSNTNLRISVRGTDGVTRVANLTLA